MDLRLTLAGAGGIAALAAIGFSFAGGAGPEWTESERARIASLSLSNLAPLPADPSNRVADDPAAAELGRALFFDKRLSANGEVACASCHVPEQQFQDGLALAQGVGQTSRRTMPLAGMAYSPWQFWDGRADSQWAQALGPLENPDEHGTNRKDVVDMIGAHYADQFVAVFGEHPDAVPVNVAFANVGKAIAAYERTIAPQRARFDDYADAMAKGEWSEALSKREREGLKLFIGKADCLNCHNGPLFSDNDFHNTGVAEVAGHPDDLGRAIGSQRVLDDPFNCLGIYSDATPEQCLELSFMKAEGEELVRAYKTPSLRQVAERAPYMHAGQIASVVDVVQHYSHAPQAPKGHSELVPLGLSQEEQAALVAFLQSLSPSP